MKTRHKGGFPVSSGKRLDNVDHIKPAATLQALRRIGPITAPILDRLADAELQHGHTARAEHLAGLAAAMREAAL